MQRKWYASGNVLPWFHRFRAGTFGYGLDQTILQGYAYLLVSYEPGDEIFIYGFSLGVRTLVEWISVSGLLPPALLNSACVTRMRSSLTSPDKDGDSGHIA